MNEFNEKKFEKMWETTEPILTWRESEKIRRGMWHKVKRHRTIMKFRIAFSTATIIIIAVIIAITPFSNKKNTDQNSFFIVSEYDYWQQLEKIPEDELIYSIMSTDIDSIENALIYQSNVETAISSLSKDEQEELLVALADEI